MNNNDVSKKLEDILSSVDKRKLQRGTQSITDLLSTPEGQKLRNKLSGVDKQKLLDAFSKMDTQKIKSALENADASKLGSMSADEIINKIKKL